MSDRYQDSFRASVRIEPADWISNDTVYSYNKIKVNGNALVFAGYNETEACQPFNVINVVCAYGQPALQAALDEQSARGPFKIKLTPPANGEALDDYFVDRSTVQSIVNKTEIKLSESVSIKNIFGYSLPNHRDPGL